MAETKGTEVAKSREVVGLFADQKQFTNAVEALREAGFARTDLSVLASHESLETAEAAVEHDAKDTLVDALRAMVGEIKFAGPLGVAGIAILFGGPVGALIGGVIAAGLGGLAIREVLSEALAHPHHEHFERAIEAGGIILWVRVADQAAETRARSLLAANGATNVHTHERELSTTNR